MGMKKSRKAIPTATYRSPWGGKRYLKPYQYQGMKEEHNREPPHIMYFNCPLGPTDIDGTGLWDRRVTYRCDCGAEQLPRTQCTRCGSKKRPEWR